MIVRPLKYVYDVSFLSGLMPVLSALTSVLDGNVGESYATTLFLIAGLIQMLVSSVTFIPTAKLPERFDTYLFAILIATSLVWILNWYVNKVNVLPELLLNIFCTILLIIVFYEKKKYGHKEDIDSERSDT